MSREVQTTLFDEKSVFDVHLTKRVRSESIRFIDLFAGIGGTRLGLERADMQCVFTSEWDSHAQEMYQANFGEQPFGDITQIDETLIPDHDLIVAGFPCQPFSISGKKAGFEDTRGTLFFDVLRIAKEKEPKVVLLENVKHLVHHDSGRTLLVMLDTLSALGYEVTWRVLNAKDFGVAQNRERIIIVASKLGRFNFDELAKVPEITIRSVLDKEGEFEFLEPDTYTILPKDMWRPQKSGLLFVGYRNQAIRKAGVRPGTIHLSRVHKQPNRIYSVDGVHPTLPSQETSGRFWIYIDGRVRKLTLNEAFRLMGFPEDFKLVGTVGNCYLRCGNSVCVPMIQEIGNQISKQLFAK